MSGRELDSLLDFKWGIRSSSNHMDFIAHVRKLLPAILEFFFFFGHFMSRKSTKGQVWTETFVGFFG